MERRMLVAIVLSVLAMFAWTTFIAKKPPPPKPVDPAVAPTVPGAGPSDPTATPGAGAPAPGMPAAAPGGPAPGAPAPSRAQHAPHREWTKALAKGAFLDARMTTRGGAIRALRLRDSFETCARDAAKQPPREPLDVLLPVDEDLLTGAIALDDADTEAMRTTDWTEVPSAEDRVVFTFATTTGLLVTKTFVFPTEPDHFDVDLHVTVAKTTGAPAKDERAVLRLLGASGLGREPSSHTSIEEANKAVFFVSHAMDDPIEHDAGFLPVALDPVEVTSRAFRFAGIRSPYHFAAVWTDPDASAPMIRRVWGNGRDHGRTPDASHARLVTFFEEVRGRVVAKDLRLNDRLKDVAGHFQRIWVEFEAPVGATGAPATASVFHLYAGPFSRSVFEAPRYATLSPSLTYPMAPDWLARLLLGVFDLFNGLTGSAGLAVILMTLAVRGGLMPLSITNQLSMRRQGRKMAKIKPKLEALKVRHASDPRRLREEQVKLYREHGIGFPLGCVMMLLQIPIFFALFAALRIEFDLRHQAFGWIRDLSGPDRLVDFGLAKGLPFTSLIPGGGIRDLNLLPILYMGLAIFQQRLMPKPLDAQQAQQMKTARWMAIIFPVLLYNYTAALALYMCVSSLIAIVESKVVRHKDAKDTAAGV